MLVISLNEHVWNENGKLYVKLFTCGHAFDIVIVLLMLRYMF